jgi:hypothetical protein
MYIIQRIAEVEESKSKAGIQIFLSKEYGERDKVRRCTGDNLKKTFSKN